MLELVNDARLSADPRREKVGSADLARRGGLFVCVACVAGSPTEEGLRKPPDERENVLDMPGERSGSAELRRCLLTLSSVLSAYFAMSVDPGPVAFGT